MIWSLWLSSLVVGAAMIVWGAFSPARLHFHERNVGAGVFGLFDGLAKVVFFAIHFGLFHAVHAALLHEFFPLKERVVFPGFELFGDVLMRFGFILPVALIAERRGFVIERMPPEPPRTSVKAADIAVRKARQAFGWEAMIMPYKNVVRMHLLLIFFGCAHFAKMESFTVYAVVYAAYFFPWRLLRRPPLVEGGTER